MTTTPPPLTTEHALELAEDLIRELAGHVGDLAAVNAVMHRWNGVLGAANLALVALAAVRTTYAACLRTVPAEQVHAGDQLLTVRAVA